MKNIKMSYNPYLKEAQLEDGTGKADEWLEAQKKGGKEFTEWCDEFLHYIIRKYNDDVGIEFNGIERDCDSLEDSITTFNKSGADFRITLMRREVRESESLESGGSKIEKLKLLYNDLRSASCPFQDLRDNNKIKESFNKALDTDFEIAVVATMSSGKSTLINAMLGTELLPARNEATTATLSYIHDDDNADHFRCEYIDERGIQQTYDPVTLKNMNELNSACVPEIHIYGDIVGISSQKLKLVLTDTPGPNNSRTDDHKMHTRKVIKDSKYKPMILYVLNGTQLEINDDNTLLNEIADAMSAGGRQASDRFLFVMNKADEFDPERDGSVSRMIDKTVEYLEKHGIKNPKIFPCSAYFAKIIRQHLAGEELTKRETRELNNNISAFIEEEERHFSDMAPLSDSARKKINRLLEEAKSANDEYRQALVHTGVPAVEAAISEYLEKYAVPAKITEALHSFKQIIDDLNNEAKEKEALKDNEKKRAEKIKAIAILQKNIAKGRQGQEFKAKIDALSVEKKIKAAYEELSGRKLFRFIEKKKTAYDKNQVTRQEAGRYTQELRQALEEFGCSFGLDIQNLINTHISGEAQQYAEEYNNYVAELLGGAFDHHVEASSILGSLAHMQFSADDIDDYEYEKKEKVGSHIETHIETRTEYKTESRTRKVEQSGWRGSAKRKIGRVVGLLFDNDWGYDYEDYTVDIPYEKSYQVQEEVDDYVMRSYINFSNFFDAQILPLFDSFSTKARQLALDTAKEEEIKLKESFKASFDELNKKIQDKLEEQQKALSEQKEFERMIQENERNIAWIADFKKRLNEALAN